MKRQVIILLLNALVCSSLSAQSVKVMTFNIRYDNPGDGANCWDERKKDLADLVLDHDPDLLGVQEALLHQMEYLREELTGFTSIGVGRQDGRVKGEFSAIFYDSTRFTVLKQETFWLSANGDTASVGWDAALERICTYGLFMDRATGDSIYVFNTHFDHRGEIARERSAELILDRILTLPDRDIPVILMGDLNTKPDERPVRILAEYLIDAAAAVPAGRSGPEGTWCTFDPEFDPVDRIDYIFTRNFQDILEVEHVRTRKTDGLNISDHLPVLTELKF